MFTLTIKTANNSFLPPTDADNHKYARDREVARILRGLAKSLEDGSGDREEGGLLDSDGFVVGKYVFL